MNYAAAPKLQDALLRCLREIEPQHIPGDVYEQAQEALVYAQESGPFLGQ